MIPSTVGTSYYIMSEGSMSQWYLALSPASLLKNGGGGEGRREAGDEARYHWLIL